MGSLIRRNVSEIPECEDSINDCAYGGKCVADPNGYKSCLCPASCPACEFFFYFYEISQFEKGPTLLTTA